MFKKLSPVFVVEKIEPCLGFWQRLGFERTVEVPYGESLGFVILAAGPVEVMYQTVASVNDDVPNASARSVSSVYIEVEALEPVLKRLGDAEVVLPRRKSSYGADEIFVREPGGSIVGFSAHAG